MPIPDRELSREELRNFSDDDFKELGIETRFWPWYFQTIWGFARIVVVLFLLVAVSSYGASVLSGGPFDYVSLAHKFVRVMLLALVVPVIFLIAAYLWWYVSNAVDKLRGR